jgi:sterol desaturase/sphingolipid hydroxylase (fatty acid hydroxylase superfamily)
LGSFLQQDEATVLFLGMVAALVVAAMLEAVRPRRAQKPDMGRRWANNIGLGLISEVNVRLVSFAAAAAVARWGQEEGIGLFSGSDLGLVPMLLIAILVFEFVSYWFHRALHAVPWLWRIHAVHHCDTELDFTTTYRNHPLELYVNAPLTIPVILLLGFPVAVVVMYQLLKTSISVFAHSNTRLPERLDRFLRRFVLTPDFHRLHHSSDRHYTDSNFSAAFPIYDYLFGTVRTAPYGMHESMELGLQYFREPLDGRLDQLLLMPLVWRPRREEAASTAPESPQFGVVSADHPRAVAAVVGE